MKWTNKKQFHREIADHIIAKYDIKKRIICEMIMDIPIEELEKVFAIQKIDPSDAELFKKAAMEDDQYMLRKIAELRENNFVEYVTVIDIDDSFGNVIKMLARMKTFGDRIREDARNKRIDEIINQVKVLMYGDKAY